MQLNVGIRGGRPYMTEQGSDEKGRESAKIKESRELGIGTRAHIGGGGGRLNCYSTYFSDIWLLGDAEKDMRLFSKELIKGTKVKNHAK